MFELIHIAQLAIGLPVFAQIDAPEGIKNILGLVRLVSFLLAIGCVIIAGILFAVGKTDAAIWGVVAAGIISLAQVLVKFAFEQTGDGLGI